MHTSARVDMEIALNATWEDAFQFDDADDTSWSFTGQNFKLELKGNIEDANPVLAISTVDGNIVVDDVTLRVLHLNVDPNTLKNSLLPWQEYVYDLVMYDGSTPAVVVPLMHGKVKTKLGVTEI